MPHGDGDMLNPFVGHSEMMHAHISNPSKLQAMNRPCSRKVEIKTILNLDHYHPWVRVLNLLKMSKNLIKTLLDAIQS